MRDEINHSSFEGKLVEVYDKFFYSGREDIIIDTVNDIDNKISLRGKRIIDIGCGTGIYEPEFVKKGTDILAADCSKEMVEYASRHRADSHIRYARLDICEKPVEEEADVVVALSHVIGYQLTNEQLRKFIKNINISLKQGGEFYFNFYHQPAVTNGSLHPQYKVVKEEGLTITRISNATVVAMENALQLNYRYIIEREAEEPFSISISEKMRYFSIMELENVLWQYGFKICECNEFLGGNELKEDHWNGCIIAKKINE